MDATTMHELEALEARLNRIEETHRLISARLESLAERIEAFA